MILFSLVASAVAAEPSWSTHSIGEVSVSLPGTVEHRSDEHSMFIGRFLSESQVSKIDGAWFAATVVTPPSAIMALSPTSSVLNEARKSILKDTVGHQEKASAIEEEGRPKGTHVSFTTTKDTGELQLGVSEIYATDQQVYTLTVVRHPSVSAAVVEQFFAEIRWSRHE